MSSCVVEPSLLNGCKKKIVWFRSFFVRYPYEQRKHFYNTTSQTYDYES